jgi:endonuclease/exonuclease/phosphatase family metal-dependent hydrolase
MIFRTYLFIMFLILGLACHPLHIYDSPEGPVFRGSFLSDQRIESDSLKVVSFNIEWGADIEQAVLQLQQSPPLQDIDVLLLQELHVPGTETIARALGMNYVYFPVVRHPRHGQDFGNAILSRWPIGTSEKILLPHGAPLIGTRRIAVRSTVVIANDSVLVYNVHTATPVSPHSKRQEQVQTVLESVPDEAPLVIAGGDFNTAWQSNIRALDAAFGEKGFLSATQSIDVTSFKGSHGFKLDHIYVRGFTLVRAGAVDTDASDHRIVWCILVNDL